MTDDRLPKKKYRVRLGYTEVSVECNSKEEAIRLARTKISADMPRLYDVIYAADDKQFRGNVVQSDSSP